MWLQGSYTSNWSGCLCCPPLKGWTRYSRQRELKSSTPFTFLNSLCEMLSCLVGTLTLLEPIFAFFLPGAVGHQSRSQSSQWRPLVCGAHCLPGFGQKPSGESTRPNVALMNGSSVNLHKWWLCWYSCSVHWSKRVKAQWTSVCSVCWALSSSLGFCFFCSLWDQLYV